MSLAGASTYTGPTNIDAGALDVNGSLASTVAVNSATLVGSGTIGGLTVANGGIVAPGNSIGTLHVAGNVGLDAGSVYQVEVNASGQSDLIAAGGMRRCPGASVQVSGALPPNLTYTILTAQGGVSGTFFGRVSPQLCVSRPATGLYPDLRAAEPAADAGFCECGRDAEPGHVAAALGMLPANGPLYQAVLTQSSAAAAQQAFNALSGEIHARYADGHAR